MLIALTYYTNGERGGEVKDWKDYEYVYSNCSTIGQKHTKVDMKVASIALKMCAYRKGLVPLMSYNCKVWNA